MVRATQLPPQTNAVGPETPESLAVDGALNAWRHKATNLVLAVVAAVHLPVIVLGMLGHGPKMGLPLKVVGLAVYLVIAAAALFHQVESRRRLSISFFALYVALALVRIALPEGPYAQAGAITLPVFALVLSGTRAARITILTSTVIILLAPMIDRQRDVTRALGIDPVQVANPPGLVWFRAAVMVAMLLGLMVLLDRFHRFLSNALRDRIAAQRKVERDARERLRLEREITGIGDQERRRLGQELHDGVCQQVTAALLRCQALARRLERGGTVSHTDFAALSSLLAETVDDAHNVARGLCPLESDPEALTPALRSLTKRVQELATVRCEFHAAGNIRLPDPEAAQHLYRVAQEALSNAVRHANARKITVELRSSDGHFMLQVEDDGVGMPPALPASGMGLRTMMYRAQILGGELTVTPAAGSGTRITCRVPVSPVARVAGKSA